MWVVGPAGSVECGPPEREGSQTALRLTGGGFRLHRVKATFDDLVEH